MQAFPPIRCHCKPCNPIFLVHPKKEPLLCSEKTNPTMKEKPNENNQPTELQQAFDDLHALLLPDADETDFTDDPCYCEIDYPESPVYADLVAHLEEYAQYDPSRKDCNPDDPFVITETEGYVHIEYVMLDALCDGEYRPNHHRADIKKQSLRSIDGRMMDVVEVEVTELTLSYNSEIELHVIGTETYYFDITNGFRSLSTLRPRSQQND